MGAKAGVVLWCRKDIVLYGYGWTRQRFSAAGILGRERLQRKQIFRLRCHEFEPNRPVGVVIELIAIGAGGWGSIFGPVPAGSSVAKRTGYWCGKSGVRFPGWSNRHSVANGSPPLRRFCVTQALRDGPQWRSQGSGIITPLPPWQLQKKWNLSFLKRTDFSSCGACRNCYHVFIPNNTIPHKTF